MRGRGSAGWRRSTARVRFRGATRDSLEFAGAYEDMKVMHAARSGALVAKRTVRPQALVCAGPIRYVGQDELRADIDNLKAALDGVERPRRRSSPRSRRPISSSTTRTSYYASDEEYLAALADAMRVEYQAIVDAGFVLQIDDPRMATHYNRAVDASIEECRKFIALRVEAVNHALRGIPGGPRALPHLLQRQHRAARARFRAASTSST